MVPCEITLNDVTLESACSGILITDVKHTAPVITRRWERLANTDSLRLVQTQKAGCGVAIEFILPMKDYTARQNAYESVVSWAGNGGELEIEGRTGQRLMCVIDQYPAIDSARNYGETLTVRFGAYERPFWELKTPASVTLTAGTSGSGTLTVPGNIDGAVIEAEVTAKAAVTTFSLTANGKTIALSGLSLQNGQIVKILYDSRMIQSIRVGTTSLLNRRTGADDLLAVCGDNAVSFTADANVEVLFKSRGAFA